MTFERIKQDTQLILESLYRFETLENKKKQEKSKRKLKEIEKEIEDLRNYITSFSSEIKSLISEERLNLQKDERRS
ncbi:MAG: hypothetical protein QGF74_00430 [Candidatus Nanoarchaeia archaeon]|jgi:hypothetical protein|nr:hypothetical protein [Candidatus Nanoarchaeia archaeon]|tara:strand:+ start:40412 stop:40639 length:228 start_codon:yes stop_codon:yes gene_type:complete